MPQTLTVKAVVFDRDGVIINTEGVVLDSIKKAFTELGFTVQDEDLPHTIGRSPDIYKEYFLKKWDFDFAEYRKIQRELFYSNLDQAQFFEDTLQLIKTLHSKKIPLAVTTSASREGTLIILNKAGITDMFKVIVAKEDCKNLKPDPEPYILTAEKLGLESKFCVAIEDTALGVESAKKAGMICIAIPNEFTTDQDFSMADAVVQSADEVENILEFI